MLVRNVSGVRVNCPALGIESLGPGATCTVEDGYAWPLLSHTGTRLPSAMENMAPQLRPADPDELAQWLKGPLPVEPPAPRTRAEVLVESGVPPAVAEILAAEGAPAPRKRRGR